jgi:hypothetical protein
VPTDAKAASADALAAGGGDSGESGDAYAATAFFAVATAVAISCGSTSDGRSLSPAVVLRTKARAGGASPCASSAHASEDMRRSLRAKHARAMRSGARPRQSL